MSNPLMRDALQECVKGLNDVMLELGYEALRPEFFRACEALRIGSETLAQLPANDFTAANEDDYAEWLKTAKVGDKLYYIPIIPQGYALVEIKPTDAMLRAAQLASGDHGDHKDWLGLQWEMGMDQVWAAMLEAAKEVQSCA